MKERIKIHYLVIPIIVIGASLVGSSLTSSGLIGWYDGLNLPSFTPPGSFIGLVWSIIYLLTAISAFVFYTQIKERRLKDIVTYLFLVNAFLNVFWSFLFFSQHLIGWAIVDSILLGVSVIALIYLIYPISKIAAALLLPYISWVCFATYLNYLIWTLN